MSKSAELRREGLENAQAALARARKLQEIVRLRLRNAAARGMGEVLRPAECDTAEVLRMIERAQRELGALWNEHYGREEEPRRHGGHGGREKKDL